MLFNSYEFIFFFLPITFFIYFYLNKKHLTVASKGFLVFASLFFYSWWNIAYLPLILFSMLINYTIGRELTHYDSKIKNYAPKKLLIVGVAFNLLLLGYFKYMDFFIFNINRVAHSEIPLLHLALPLAISFYTFQQIAYLVDSYRHETKEYDFLNYAVFVTFFPQLIAGPIVHHAEMMPQFAQLKNKVKSYHNISLGLFIFSIGLFKKVVIADSFAVWVNTGFNMVDTLTFLEAWITSLSYTFQLYFDFSGYADMAIGVALLFNIKIPINFNSPYKATNIQDFWRRWHITLSRFLKDYIYIPLGGNRKGEIRTYTNLFATFVLGGIWHGAGWTFVFWGMLHGFALVIQKLWSNLGFKMNVILAWVLTFNFINIAWVFFRAEKWDDAIKILYAMLTPSFSVKIFQDKNPLLDYLHSLVFPLYSKEFTSFYIGEMLVFGFIIILTTQNTYQLSVKFDKMKRVSFSYYFLSICLLGISLIYLSIGTGSVFLYFNF